MLGHICSYAVLIGVYRMVASGPGVYWVYALPSGATEVAPLAPEEIIVWHRGNLQDAEPDGDDAGAVRAVRAPLEDHRHQLGGRKWV